MFTLLGVAAGISMGWILCVGVIAIIIGLTHTR